MYYKVFYGYKSPLYQKITYPLFQAAMHDLFESSEFYNYESSVFANQWVANSKRVFK